jgi:hypothetical protein
MVGYHFKHCGHKAKHRPTLRQAAVAACGDAAQPRNVERQVRYVAREEDMELGTLFSGVQAGGSVITAVASVFFLYQVVLLKRQLTQGAEQLLQAKQQLASGVQWNKLNAAFTYFHSDVVLQKERAAARSLQKVGFDLHTEKGPLTPAQVDLLKGDFDQFADVKDFLNLLEDYCTAVRIGAIDDNAAYAMMSGMIIRWQRSLRAFVDERRKNVGDSEVFCELEALAERWATRDAENRRQREAEHDEGKRRLN